MIVSRRHTRAAPPILLGIAGALVVLILLWLFLPRTARPYNRQTYILVSDPMIVASWDLNGRTLTLITIPKDVASEGTHGYGMYSLEAFWRLGEIDKKNGTVLAESISEALGIPIDGYIGARTGLLPARADALATVKSVFSLGSSVGVLTGSYRTNIPFQAFFVLAWRVNVLRPDRVSVYDFTHNTTAIAQNIELPDNSTQLVLDPARLDSQLTSVFEDESVRQESVTVAVYNTTDMPSLGNRVGRLLTNLGVSVVIVGNDTPEVGVCTTTGNATALKSKSTEVIIAVLGCRRIVGETSRADLIIRIGSSYAKRFLPN